MVTGVPGGRGEEEVEGGGRWEGGEEGAGRSFLADREGGGRLGGGVATRERGRRGGVEREKDMVDWVATTGRGGEEEGGKADGWDLSC